MCKVIHDMAVCTRNRTRAILDLVGTPLNALSELEFSDPDSLSALVGKRARSFTIDEEIKDTTVTSLNRDFPGLNVQRIRRHKMYPHVYGNWIERDGPVFGAQPRIHVRGYEDLQAMPSGRRANYVIMGRRDARGSLVEYSLLVHVLLCRSEMFAKHMDIVLHHATRHASSLGDILIVAAGEMIKLDGVVHYNGMTGTLQDDIASSFRIVDEKSSRGVYEELFGRLSQTLLCPRGTFQYEMMTEKEMFSTRTAPLDSWCARRFPDSFDTKDIVVVAKWWSFETTDDFLAEITQRGGSELFRRLERSIHSSPQMDSFIGGICELIDGKSRKRKQRHISSSISSNRE